MTCTFFGHRDCPDSVEKPLTKALILLIEKKDVNTFYVGNEGKFDRMVKRKLFELKKIHPAIKYSIVSAYMPNEKNTSDPEHTIYPEGLESTPLKYAIIKRNLWMIEKSDFVITYVNKIIGGAKTFKEISEKKGKTVINLKC